ncbi:MAG TPA: hypothetical protein VFK17_06345 [Gaiellaceae bacterium]|nr:hypothetical protein [Gaiellaceae bacterium]
MSTRISPQIRIVALAGLLLAVAGGGASMLLTRSHAGPEVVTTPALTHPRASTPVATVPAKHVTTPARHASKPTVHARHAAKPATHPATHRGNLVDARLPAQLQWALSQHRIVVVGIYNPRADVDAISVAEAHAGAEDAGAGFLLVSVLDDKVAGQLTGLLPGGGLLPEPGVLVFRAPGKLVYRFDGFTDRAAVAQAAENAKSAGGDPAVTDPSLAQPATATTP